MVTPNPENQLELEIVSAMPEASTPVEAPAEVPAAVPAAVPADPLVNDDFGDMVDADVDVEESPDPTPLKTPQEPIGDVPPPTPPITPPAPAVDPVLQQQLWQQQQQLQQYREQQYQQEVAKAVADYTAKLENEGYMPEQANQMAAEARKNAEHDLQIRQQHQTQLNFQQGQHNAARHYARQYKLTIDDMEQLEQLQSPQAMAREAQRISEVRDLKTQVDDMKRAQVPAQEFDSGRSSPGGGRSRQRLLEAYADGSIELTRDQYEKLMRSG